MVTFLRFKVITHNCILRDILGDQLWTNSGKSPLGFENGEIRRFVVLPPPPASGSTSTVPHPDITSTPKTRRLSVVDRVTGITIISEEPRTIETNSVRNEVAAVGYLD